MRKLEVLRRDVKNAYKRLKNWRAVGREFQITSGMAYRIAMDKYEPKDPHIRYLLGLPALVPAPVCPECGEIHLAKRCPKRARPKRVQDMTAEELRWALEHRKVINDQ